MHVKFMHVSKRDPWMDGKRQKIHLTPGTHPVYIGDKKKTYTDL